MHAAFYRSKFYDLQASFIFILQMTELELEECFGQYGSVKDAKIITDRQGIPKGWASTHVCKLGHARSWILKKAYVIIIMTFLTLAS